MPESIDILVKFCSKVQRINVLMTEGKCWVCRKTRNQRNFFLTFFFNDKVIYRMPIESEDKRDVLEAQAKWRE